MSGKKPGSQVMQQARINSGLCCVWGRNCGTSSAILEFTAKLPMITKTEADPKSIKVHQTAGTGMDIEWKDGHQSAYSFVFLRDACPCALCNEEREKDGRQPGDPLKTVAGALPMFKALAKPTKVEPVGKYAIRFVWNDGHEHGIFSWEYLREHCPCAECKARRAMEAPATGAKPN
jgi:DUF971 family protein